MSMLDRPVELWRIIWKRTLVLAGCCLLPVLALGQWRLAAGLLLGAALVLGEVYALVKTLEPLVGSGRMGKRFLFLGFGALRLIVLAGIALLAVKFGLASFFGVFIGVSLPMVAAGSLLLTRGATKWEF